MSGHRWTQVGMRVAVDDTVRALLATSAELRMGVLATQIVGVPDPQRLEFTVAVAIRIAAVVDAAGEISPHGRRRPRHEIKGRR